MNSPEDRLLRTIARATNAAKPKGSLRLGLGDDAALWAPQAGFETILTCDWFLEGSHFLRGIHPPDSVGWKCLARAVSDVAAMGGEPKCFLLSLALPLSHTRRWLDQFLDGLRRAAQHFGCRLAGGDTTRHDEILINITVIGDVRAGKAVLRSGAKARDLIFVSGRLGEAELGLRSLRRSRTASRRNSSSIEKHLYPDPRLALGQWLAKNRIATAMMDLSDGLSSDLPRLCAASGVGALIDAGKIPSINPAEGPSLSSANRLALALNGGDDYELLFTMRPSNARRVPSRFRGIPLTCVGKVTRKRVIQLVQANGRKKTFVPGGWDPFRR
jgi:thiamine-monophosphate kinase